MHIAVEVFTEKYILYFCKTYFAVELSDDRRRTAENGDGDSGSGSGSV